MEAVSNYRIFGSIKKYPNLQEIDGL